MHILKPSLPYHICFSNYVLYGLSQHRQNIKKYHSAGFRILVHLTNLFSLPVFLGYPTHNKIFSRNEVTDLGGPPPPLYGQNP